MKRWKERLVACVLLLGFLGAGLVLVPQQPARPAWAQEWLASKPVHSFEGVTLAHKPATATALAAAAPREAAPHRLAVLVEAAVVHAAQQPPQPAPQVRLPATPPAPQPPQPVPGAATKLGANQWYIIDSDLALVVLTSPPGLVGVGKEGGPIKLRGWFVDAVAVETRTYQGKFIYCLDATGVGKVELLIIRSDNQEVIRRWLDVDNGGPAPKPPDPKPPDPKPPEPPAPIPGAGLRVLILYETAQSTAMPKEQQNILFGKPMRDYLKAKCIVDKDNPLGAFRIWDKDVSAAAESKPWQDALARPRASIPWLIISNGKTGWEGPLPATVDATMAIIKKYEQ